LRMKNLDSTIIGFIYNLPLFCLGCTLRYRNNSPNILRQYILTIFLYQTKQCLTKQMM